MPKSPNQKLKLLVLKDYLLKNSDENHPVTMPQIIEELARYDIKAERKSLYDDIEALRLYGLDIIQDKRNYYVGQRSFETPELKLLVDSIQSSKFITQKKSRVLAAKLLNLTSRPTAAGLKRNISIADRIKPKNEHIYYFVDVINEAINTKRKISFLYFAFTPAKKKELKNGGEPYLLSPYTLTWNGDCYYVVGWSDKHGKVATFRVDRILETPRILAEPAVLRPKNYSIADFAEKAFQLFDADRTEVTLLCDTVAMNSVLDHFGDRASTEPVDEHTFRLTAEVSLSPTFFAWVFQFGGKVRLLGPEEAIEKYQSLLRAGQPLPRCRSTGCSPCPSSAV